MTPCPLCKSAGVLHPAAGFLVAGASCSNSDCLLHISRQDECNCHIRAEDWPKQDDQLALYEEVLQRIAQWSEAYPLQVFPELTPADWQKAREALKAAGITLDRISASNMRHVLAGVGVIAKQALGEIDMDPALKNAMQS